MNIRSTFFTYYFLPVSIKLAGSRNILIDEALIYFRVFSFMFAIKTWWGGVLLKV